MKVTVRDIVDAQIIQFRGQFHKLLYWEMESTPAWENCGFSVSPSSLTGKASEVTEDRGSRPQILVFCVVSEILRLKVSLSHGPQKAWRTG